MSGTTLRWPGRLLAWRRGPRSKLREYLETFFAALVIAFLIRATFIEARYIPSESMLPTLRVGDRLIVEKLSYHFHPPRRGDMIVFDPPPAAHGDGNAFIKRVIGLPGDRMRIHDGHVYVNGRPLIEPYTLEPPLYPEPDWDAIGMPGGVVPRGCVFVMGDNRNDSEDSHIWGPEPMRHIIGQAVFRFWPPAHFGFLPHAVMRYGAAS